MNIERGLYYAGAFYDALRSLGLADKEFVISPTIKPLDHESQVYGPVYTCRGSHVPSGGYAQAERVQQEMWGRIEARQVVVLQADDGYCAHAGDITMLIYRQLGAGGFVTDGMLRDSRAIRRLGLPCFCMGTTAIDALEYWAIVEVGRPVTLPGVLAPVPVKPGDWIYGDADGVLRIPAVKLNEFQAAMEAVVKREDDIRKRIAQAEQSEVAATARRAHEEHGRW